MDIESDSFEITNGEVLDKIDLLKPGCICEKGYRHYSIQQYLDLEIIVNLRSFNISIPAIKAYLEKRSKSDFINLVAIKKKEICLMNSLCSIKV